MAISEPHTGIYETGIDAKDEKKEDE